MAATKKVQRVTFQCPPTLKRKLDQRAKAENRTTSNLIVTLLSKILHEKMTHTEKEREEAH